MIFRLITCPQSEADEADRGPGNRLTGLSSGFPHHSHRVKLDIRTYKTIPVPSGKTSPNNPFERSP